MTYNVSNGTLNPTILYYTFQRTHSCVDPWNSWWRTSAVLKSKVVKSRHLNEKLSDFDEIWDLADLEIDDIMWPSMKISKIQDVGRPPYWISFLAITQQLILSDFNEILRGTRTERISCFPNAAWLSESWGFSYNLHYTCYFHFNGSGRRTQVFISPIKGPQLICDTTAQCTRSVARFLCSKLNTISRTIEGHSVERMYLRQRCSHGSILYTLTVDRFI